MRKIINLINGLFIKPEQSTDLIQKGFKSVYPQGRQPIF